MRSDNRVSFDLGYDFDITKSVASLRLNDHIIPPILRYVNSELVDRESIIQHINYLDNYRKELVRLVNYGKEPKPEFGFFQRDIMRTWHKGDYK